MQIISTAQAPSILFSSLSLHTVIVILQRLHSTAL